MGINRETRVFLKIPDLGQAVPVFEGQLGERVAWEGKKGLVNLIRLLRLPLELAGVKLGMEYHIDKTAKDRKEKDKKNPGEFIGGFFFFVKHIEADKNADAVKNIIRVAEDETRAA
jgi:hypothetical protein